MGYLGLRLDEEKNRALAYADRIISSQDSTVAVLVVYTNEELMVARESVRVLRQRGTQNKST